jgi:hypothetical protein
MTSSNLTGLPPYPNGQGAILARQIENAHLGKQQDAADRIKRALTAYEEILAMLIEAHEARQGRKAKFQAYAPALNTDTFLPQNRGVNVNTTIGA